MMILPLPTYCGTHRVDARGIGFHTVRVRWTSFVKTSGREFVHQLSDQVLGFTMKVKCPKTGEEIETKFTRSQVSS